MKERPRVFDVTVAFCVIEAENELAAREQVEQHLRDAFMNLPDSVIRIPWVVDTVQELKRGV